MVILNEKLLDLAPIKLLLQQLLGLDSEQLLDEHQAIPQHYPLYLQLSWAGSRPLGAASLDFMGSTEVESVSASWHSRLKITAYGDEAYPVLMRIYSLLHSSQGKRLLKRLRMGLVSSSEIQNLTHNDNENAQIFVQMELTLSHQSVVEVGQRRIDHAGVTVHTERQTNINQ